jgi:large repetitive protein
MTITSEGLTDIGNFSGEAKFDLMDIATLELGRFIRQQDDDGFVLTIADGFGAGPEDLRDSEEATQEIDVVEFLCFGPCDEYQIADEEEGPPVTTVAGTQTNGNPALRLSLGGSSNNPNGAFSGGIHQILFYRTTAGDVTFSVERFEVGLGDLFEASASLLYQTSGGNITLLAAGSGSLAVGDQSVGAMIAGTFSNMDDELSFGVFAAVRASMGIQIVPGVVSLTGFGGGFFYNPTDQMLDMVTDAVDVFRTDAPEGITRAGATRPGSGDISFAVLLLAELELIGAGGTSLLAGSTFMEITNQYFYMDADGIIMGLDGNRAPGLLAGGGISAQIGRNPNDPEAITMSVNLQASLRMMPMMSGWTTGDGIQFMLTKTESDVVWGLMGGVQMEFYGGLIGGGAHLLASNDGFLFEVDFWASLDPPIITIEASIEGSIWYLTYEGVSMPLGAYVIGNGEISAGITVTAEIKGAFVQRGERYELFGMGEGCISAGPFDPCLAGWFQIKTNPLVVEGGLNPGDRSELFEEAKAQRDQFEEMVIAAMNNLQTEMDRPVVPGVILDEHLLARAGYNLMMTSDTQRSQWHSYMIMNEQGGGHTVPQILEGLQVFEDFGAFISFLAGGSYRNDSQLNANSATSWMQAESDLEDRLAMVQNIATETVNRLQNSLIKAIEYESEAIEAVEQMFSLMTASPVTRVYRPQGPMNENNVPDFEINTDMAEDQSQAIGGLVEAIEALESQIHAVVDSIEHNLGEMDNLLGMAHVADIIDTGTDNPTINTVSQMYGETLQAVDRYYSLLANSYWHKINAAGMVNNVFGAFESQLEDAVSTLQGRLVSAYNTRASNPQQYQTERNKAATRVWFVEALALDADNFNFPSDQNFSGFPLAQQAYNDLADPEVDDFSNYEQNTRDLWINMHTIGNRRYMLEKARFIVNDLNQNYLYTRESLLAIMRINTELIDDFYDVKSSMLANLYHIIDNYVEIRMQVNPEDEEGRLSAYQSRRQEILQLLEPPVLTKVTVDTDYLNHHFFGTAEIMWEASHPIGIAEASIHVTQYAWSDDTGIDVGHGEYATIGNTDSFTYTAFKSMFERENVLADSDWLNTSTVNVGIRLRSQGGATASRRAVFNMQVGSGGVSSTPGQNLLPSTTSPPEAMYVHLEHFYNKGSVTETTFMRDLQGRTIPIVLEQEMYWTGQPEFIRIRTMVKEPETNIMKYEYAVGSSRGGDDIIGWTELVGTRSSLIGTIWGYYTEELIAQTRIINMTPGENYYVSVRAYNMNDQVIESNWPVPVVYDNTPPTAPGRPSDDLLIAHNTLSSTPHMSGFSIGGTSYAPSVDPRPFVTTAPNYSLTTTQQRQRNETDVIPSLGTMLWTESIDNESGLWRYEYLVTTAPQVTDMDFESGAFTTDETQVEIMSGTGAHSQLSFDFTDQMYVHVRAVNHAKLGSDVLTYGPNYPRDPTPPTEPVVVGHQAAQSIKAYLIERSYDPESGMAGHQYSIGTSPGASDVRAWPDDDTMDFTNTSLVRNWSTAPSIDIPTDDLPWNTNLYINVRGINGQGTKSRMASTGPFVLSFAKPSDPLISLTDRVGDNLEVKIDGLKYEDLATLDKIEVRVLHDDGTTTTPIGTWQQSADTFSGSTGSKLTNFNIDSSYDMENITVEVTVTNTAGLETTVMESYSSGATTNLNHTGQLDGSTTFQSMDPLIPRF